LVLAAAKRAGLIFVRWIPGERRLHVDGAVEELLGYTTEDFEKDPTLFLRVVEPDVGGDIRPLLRSIMRTTSDRQDVRIRAKTRGGDVRHMDCALAAVRDAKGTLIGWEGFARDLSTSDGLERLVAEGYQRFQTLFHSAPLAMVLFDPKTLTIEQVNARAAQMYGIAREEMEGSFVSEYVSPDEWPRVQELVRQSTEASSQVTILQRVLHRRVDGTVFPVQTAAVTVPVTGRARRMVVIRDLSDIEAAEERIRAAYRTIEANPSPMVLLDRTWVVAFANAAAASLFGRTREDLKGRTFGSLLEPRFASEFQAERASLVPGTAWERLASITHASGKAVRTHVSLVAVPDSPDADVSFVGTLRPVDRSAAHRELTSEEIAVFFDLLAHDVVNYLTAVRGYIELMSADPDLGERNRRMAEIARSQSQNALDLIHDTRRVVGLDRSNTQVAAKGDLIRVLDDAVVRIEPILKSRTFKVRRDFALPSAAIPNPDVVREVFVNILHNAVKYDANEEVVLDLVVERAGAEEAPLWRVRVGDRGVGIPDDEKAHVFERGFRRQASRPAEGGAMAPKGSGIGLSICKFLIERLGGSLRVENRIPGDWKQGTNFIVELPAV
jgi:PAS domain S-box-containing protein